MPRWIRSGFAALAILEGGAAAAQDTSAPLGARGDLPFSRDPATPYGPPRSMGEEGFYQTLPPSDRATQMQGPPRSMGELPENLTILPGSVPGASPIRSVLPELSSDVSLMPDLLSQPGLRPGEGSLPDSLLLLPGLFGGVRPGDPNTPDVPGSFAAPPDSRLIPAPPRINDETPLSPLTWDQVRVTAERTYPPFLAVLENRPLADGQIMSAEGAFDLGLSADSRNYPLGYYQRTVQDAFAEIPLRNLGGKFFTGYRVGTGYFPPYYLNLQTKTGGAFVNGFELPLLRNRAIDAKRAKLYSAEIERKKVEPGVQKNRIKLMADATKAYWAWLSSGYIYAVTQDLVQTTDYQFRAVQQQVKEGRVSPLALIAFQNIFIKRKQQLVQANREFQRSTIELSLYVRDERGFPTLVDRRALPVAFPAARPPDETRFLEDLSVAMELRPDLRSVDLEMQKAHVQRDLAQNEFKPQLNFYMYTEQNVGKYIPNLNQDNRPFILESSLLFEMPLQRRYARGLIRSADASIRQVSLAKRYAVDTVRAEVQDGFSQLRNAYDDLQLYRSAEAVTRQLELAERTSLEAGRSNSLLLFVREQSTYDAQTLRLAAEYKYFSALATYRASLALDAVPPDVEAGYMPAPSTLPGPTPSSVSSSLPASAPPSLEREAHEAGIATPPGDDPSEAAPTPPPADSPSPFNEPARTSTPGTPPTPPSPASPDRPTPGAP